MDRLKQALKDQLEECIRIREAIQIAVEYERAEVIQELMEDLYVEIRKLNSLLIGES